MKKQMITVAGYRITQPSETTHEADNPQESLDFYFDTEDPEEVEVTVFDSTIPNKSGNVLILRFGMRNRLKKRLKSV
jgi:hypothetical protein